MGEDLSPEDEAFVNASCGDGEATITLSPPTLRFFDCFGLFRYVDTVDVAHTVGDKRGEVAGRSRFEADEEPTLGAEREMEDDGLLADLKRGVFRPEFLERQRLRRVPLPGEIRSERFQAVLDNISGEVVTAVDKLAVLTIVPADGSKRAPRSALQVINQVLVRAHIDGMLDRRYSPPDALR